VSGGPTPLDPRIDVSALGAPTTPPPAGEAAPRANPLGSPVDALTPAPPRAELSNSFSFAPPQVAPAASSRAGSGPPGVVPKEPAGHNPFDTISAPGGPAPAGSSLLAVLASYVIPGGGSLPGSTLMLLVQLAVILAAFYAPRLGLGERVLALGRLGPRFGYRTVLARPG
jgi:hypothetical protein